MRSNAGTRLPHTNRKSPAIAGLSYFCGPWSVVFLFVIGVRPLHFPLACEAIVRPAVLVQPGSDLDLALLAPLGFPVHVFRRDGKHITSIVYPGTTIRDRIGRRRWTPLESEAIEQLRAGIAARGTIPDEEDQAGKTLGS